VEVCPSDAFKEGPNFLVIDPDLCVDCHLCPAECPAEAIYAEDELPDSQKHFQQLNEELALAWPEISEAKEALTHFEFWDGQTGKIKHLIKDW